MTLPQLYTLDEVASAMKLKPDTVARHIARHDIPRVGAGRGLRLTRAAYDLLIQRLCSDSSPRRSLFPLDHPRPSCRTARRDQHWHG